MRSKSVGMIGAAGLVLAGGAWLFMAQQGNSAGIFPYEDADAVAAGAALYSENCAACHGADLAGEPDWRSPGPDGLLPAPPHDETGHTWHHPDAQLFAITKYGTAALVGGDYQSRMQGFGEVLSDKEIVQILAYVKSTWPDRVIAQHNQINAAQ